MGKRVLAMLHCEASNSQPAALIRYSCPALKALQGSGERLGLNQASGSSVAIELRSNEVKSISDPNAKKDR